MQSWVKRRLAVGSDVWLDLSLVKLGRKGITAESEAPPATEDVDTIEFCALGIAALNRRRELPSKDLVGDAVGGRILIVGEQKPVLVELLKRLRPKLTLFDTDALENLCRDVLGAFGNVLPRSVPG